MRHFRAAIRLVLLILWIPSVCFFATFTYFLSPRRLHPKIVVLCNRGELKIAGVKVHITGDPPRNPEGILFVANHCSYLDIPVYGGLLQVCYTPKAEIKRWPFIGQLTILARSVFITRDKEHAEAQRTNLRRLLDEGNNILLFPEGTTNDGSHVKPFKSSLFSVAAPAEGQPGIPIRALAVTYKVNGKPPRSGRMLDRVAWYGDMTLLPHLWALLSMQSIEARVAFLPPITWEGSRKQMATRYGELVAEKVQSILEASEQK